MVNLLKSARIGMLLSTVAGAWMLGGCASQYGERSLLPEASGDAQYSTRYRIAPGDSVQIFVWRNPEVSTSVPVRPDGLLSAPLLEEVPAAGKTPAELARDLEAELSVSRSQGGAGAGLGAPVLAGLARPSRAAARTGPRGDPGP